MTATGHIQCLQGQNYPERTTAQSWHGSPPLWHHCCCSRRGLLPPHCPLSLALAAPATLPASAGDSAPLPAAQHRTCMLAPVAATHIPAAWSRAHHPQLCPAPDACGLITTHAHGAAWDLVPATQDSHGVCRAGWNPAPVTVAPEALSAQSHSPVLLRARDRVPYVPMPTASVPAACPLAAWS